MPGFRTAVADGASYTQAARALGRRSNDAVSNLAARFNREGVLATAPATAVGARAITGPASVSASWPSSAAALTEPRMALRPGRSAPCNMPCATLLTASPKSAPLRSGESCARPAIPGNSLAPGVPPTRPRASAKLDFLASPTPIPEEKKLD